MRYGLIGGAPGEEIAVEIHVDGQPLRRRESRLDPAGFTILGFSPETASLPGPKLLRVLSPGLGRVEAGLREDGTFEDAAPRRAPVQIPSRGDPALAPAA